MELRQPRVSGTSLSIMQFAGAVLQVPHPPPRTAPERPSVSVAIHLQAIQRSSWHMIDAMNRGIGVSA